MMYAVIASVVAISSLVPTLADGKISTFCRSFFFLKLLCYSYLTVAFAMPTCTNDVNWRIRYRLMLNCDH